MLSLTSNPSTYHMIRAYPDHVLLFCALVSKEKQKPQNSEADTPIIGATAHATRAQTSSPKRPICARSIHRKTDQTAHISLQVPIMSNSTPDTKQHRASPQHRGATPCNPASDLSDTRRTIRSPQRLPDRSSPPPVKRYLDTQSPTRKTKSTKR